MLSTEPMVKAPYRIDPVVIAVCFLICAAPATVGFFLARSEIEVLAGLKERLFGAAKKGT
jgi:hypothetical protein